MRIQFVSALRHSEAEHVHCQVTAMELCDSRNHCTHMSVLICVVLQQKVCTAMLLVGSHHHTRITVVVFAIK